MKRAFALLFLLTAAHCNPRPAVPPERGAHIAAASSFTKLFAHSRLKGWNVRAAAAGSDCAVLLVETPMALEDSIVEAMHYGGGAYSVVDGGVQHFCRQRAFRGVAYRDSAGRIWTYGDVTRAEAEALAPCG